MVIVLQLEILFLPDQIITNDPMAYSFAHHKVWPPKYGKLCLEYCALATICKFFYTCLDRVWGDFHVLIDHLFLHIDQHKESPEKKICLMELGKDMILLIDQVAVSATFIIEFSSESSKWCKWKQSVKLLKTYQINITLV